MPKLSLLRRMHGKNIGPRSSDILYAGLLEHRTAGERNYRRDHYLVGSLRCGLCDSSLLYTVVRGRAGREHGYFYCSSKLRGAQRKQRNLPDQLVEEAVEAQWSREAVPQTLVDSLRANLTADIEEHAKETQQQIEAYERRAHAIRRERFKWAEKVMAGVVPDDVASVKRQARAKELAHVQAEVERCQTLNQVDGQALDRLFALVSDAGVTYRQADEVLRRAMNQAWFHHLVITEGADGLTVSDQERESIMAAVNRLTSSA